MRIRQDRIDPTFQVISRSRLYSRILPMETCDSELAWNGQGLGPDFEAGCERSGAARVMRPGLQAGNWILRLCFIQVWIAARANCLSHGRPGTLISGFWISIFRTLPPPPPDHRWAKMSEASISFDVRALSLRPLGTMELRCFGARTLKCDFYLQHQVRRFQISDFRLQISDFRFRISDFRFEISDFRKLILGELGSGIWGNRWRPSGGTLPGEWQHLPFKLLYKNPLKIPWGDP